MKVAVIDSGIVSEHPAVGGHLGGYVVLTDGLLGLLHDTESHGDSYGHGTACAGIIRSVAPGCELYSVKVLGSRLTGRGTTFAAGLRWAIENGMDVCNVSMGTTRKIFFAALHDLADKAYFRNTVLVTAANNMPAPSFPSLYSSVVSGASHDGKDPYLFYYNPRRRLRRGPARLGPLPGGALRDKQLAVGARLGTSGDLPAPAVPRREAPLQEVEIPRVAVWSGTRVS